MIASLGWFCLMKSVNGPSSLLNSSPLKLFVMFWIPSATPSSLPMIAARSGWSFDASTVLLSTTSGAVPVPKVSATKFCPIRPANCTVARLSVRTSAAGSTAITTSTLVPASLMDLTRPMVTPASFTGSPFLRSRTLENCALTSRPRAKTAPLPISSNSMNAAMTTRAKKIPRRVSRVFFMARSGSG